MVTHWQRRQEGGGRVGGNKGRKTEMEVVILGVLPVALASVCQEGRVDLAAHLPYQPAT